MEMTTVKLFSKKLLMKNPRFNWLKPVFVQLSDITD